jgi:hypothetical protein
MASGCTTTTKKHPGVGIGSLHMAALERNEYAIMDTVEGAGKTTTVLGIFKFPLNRQTGYTLWAGGGEAPPPALSGGGFFARRTGVNQASAMAFYNVLAQVPNADAVMPTISTVETTGIPFLIRTHTATVKGKAVRIKTDSELDM